MAKKIKQKSVIVFDVSDYSVEVIEAHSLGGNVEILNQGRVLIGEGLIEKGEAVDVEQISTVLFKVMLEAKIIDPDLKDIVLILPSSQLFYQLMDVENKDFKEQKNLIKEKLVETTPINGEDINFVYKKANLAKVTILRKNKENLKKFFTVAFRKSLPQSWLQVFENLNLSLKYFELDLSAHYFALNLEKEVDTTCVIDFGARNTNIFFWQKDKMRYVYTFFWGGEDLTRIIEKYLGISFSEAEDLKKEFGLIRSYKKDDEKNILYPILEEFAADLKLNINFYEENYISIIKKIILIGGGSNLKGLKSFLVNKRNNKKCEIKRADVLREKDVDSVYHNSYGAAFSFLNKKYKDNFYIPANKNENIEKDFSGERDLVNYVKNNLLNIKEVKIDISKERRPFYFVLLLVVFVVTTFAFFVHFKGKSDQEFLANQARIMDSEKELKEKIILKEKKEVEDVVEDKKHIEIKFLSTSLRVRGGAGTNFSVVGKTEGGERYEILQKENAWVEIEFKEGQTGWVSEVFVEFID